MRLACQIPPGIIRMSTEGHLGRTQFKVTRARSCDDCGLLLGKCQASWFYGNPNAGVSCFGAQSTILKRGPSPFRQRDYDYKTEDARAHLAFRLTPDFATVPHFASRRNTVSARSATISLNAASSAGIPFACMTAAVISADVSGPDAVRKASCVSLDSSLWAKYRVRR